MRKPPSGEWRAAFILKQNGAGLSLQEELMPKCRQALAACWVPSA